MYMKKVINFGKIFFSLNKQRELGHISKKSLGERISTEKKNNQINTKSWNIVSEIQILYLKWCSHYQTQGLWPTENMGGEWVKK